MQFDDIPRPGLWKRLILAAFLVIFAAAGATAVAAFNEVDKVVDALKLGPELRVSEKSLAKTDPGEPQTLMILGSDKRPKDNVEGAASDGSLGHDHARPSESGQGGDGDHVAAARPQGGDPGLRRRRRSTRRTRTAARS